MGRFPFGLFGHQHRRSTPSVINFDFLFSWRSAPAIRGEEKFFNDERLLKLAASLDLKFRVIDFENDVRRTNAPSVF